MTLLKVSCALLFISLSVATSCVQASPSRSLSVRKLLHDTSDADSDSVSSTNFLDVLQSQGITAAERLDQVLSVPVSTALNENDVNTLLQDVQG